EGVLHVGDLALEPARSVPANADLAALAAFFHDQEAGFAAVLDKRRFLGVVYLDDLLAAIADHRQDAKARALVSSQIPTCAPASTLVDAVRQMVACFLRSLPVVGDDGALVGFVSLPCAVAAAERDPAVRDFLEAVAISPSLFARCWR